jgi:hypothetical protein
MNACTACKPHLQVNQAMQLDWADADIKKYAAIFEVWNQGFTPSTKDPRWAEGMKAR